jgi:hypothetical protein
MPVLFSQWASPSGGCGEKKRALTSIEGQLAMGSLERRKRQESDREEQDGTRLGGYELDIHEPVA